MTLPVRATDWFKSSHSGAASEGCMEVRITDATVGVRDSKHRGPSFAVPTGAWNRFVAAVKDDRIE